MPIVIIIITIIITTKAMVVHHHHYHPTFHSSVFPPLTISKGSSAHLFHIKPTISSSSSSSSSFTQSPWNHWNLSSVFYRSLFSCYYAIRLKDRFTSFKFFSSPKMLLNFFCADFVAISWWSAIKYWVCGKETQTVRNVRINPNPTKQPSKFSPTAPHFRK